MAENIIGGNFPLNSLIACSKHLFIFSGVNILNFGDKKADEADIKVQNLTVSAANSKNIKIEEILVFRSPLLKEMQIPRTSSPGKNKYYY